MDIRLIKQGEKMLCVKELGEMTNQEIEDDLVALREEVRVLDAKERCARYYADKLMKPWWQWWRRADADLLYFTAIIFQHQKERKQEVIQELEKVLHEGIRRRFAL